MKSLSLVLLIWVVSSCSQPEPLSTVKSWSSMDLNESYVGLCGEGIEKATSVPKPLAEAETEEVDEALNLNNSVAIGVADTPDAGDGVSAIDITHPQAPAFISEIDKVKCVEKDLVNQEEDVRPFLRYFSFAHFYNSGVSNEKILTYQKALFKVLNSLSWEEDLNMPIAIDKIGALWRVDLREFGLQGKQWQKIDDFVDFKMGIDMRKGNELVYTHSNLPIVRADWFVAQATQPSLYSALLLLPKTEAELTARLEINLAENLDPDVRVDANPNKQQYPAVMRSGFSVSDVSRNNRMTERHENKGQVYWKTYDFSWDASITNLGELKNIFMNPLGPKEGARPEPEEPDFDQWRFKQDVSEVIFNLPNGLNGYMIFDGEGNALETPPANTTSYKHRSSGLNSGQTITNGASCMGCHTTGVFGKTDEVLDALTITPFHDTKTFGKVEMLHGSRRFSPAVASDKKRFIDAARELGISSKVEDPITATIADFEKPLNLTEAAAEASLKPEELKNIILRDQVVLKPRLLHLLNDGVVHRELFRELFKSIVNGALMKPLILTERKVTP